MGPLHDPVTWYKIIYTGEQVAQWDFQNNATRTSSPGPAFVLEVPLRNLLTSIYNFVPCDWVVQRAHYQPLFRKKAHACRPEVDPKNADNLIRAFSTISAP